MRTLYEVRDKKGDFIRYSEVINKMESKQYDFHLIRVAEESYRRSLIELSKHIKKLQAKRMTEPIEEYLERLKEKKKGHSSLVMSIADSYDNLTSQERAKLIYMLSEAEKWGKEKGE